MSKMALALSLRKPMNEGYRDLLMSNMAILQDDPELLKVLPYMTSALEDGDFAAIRNLPTLREQVKMLLTILPKRGEEAVQCFIENLKVTQPNHRIFEKSGEYLICVSPIISTFKSFQINLNHLN